MNTAQRMTLVTILTTLRIPLVWAFACLAVMAALRDSVALAVGAFACLCIGALTDLFDGYAARKLNVCTELGAYADPFADKVFYLVVLPVLVFVAAVKQQSVHGVILLVLTLLFLLRDVWVSFLRSLGSEENADVRANWSGKLRTAMSFPIVCAVYAFLGWLPILPLWLIYSTEIAGIVVNLISVFIYTRDYWPYLRSASRR